MFVPMNEEEVDAYKAWLVTHNPGPLNSVGLAVRIVSINIEEIVRMADEETVDTHSFTRKEQHNVKSL